MSALTSLDTQRLTVSLLMLMDCSVLSKALISVHSRSLRGAQGETQGNEAMYNC